MTGKWFVNLCVEDEGLQVLGGGRSVEIETLCTG